jgi:hypothetical protein
MMMMMKNQNVDNCFCYSIIQFVNIKHYVLVDLRSHTVYIHTTHDLSRRGSRHISNISLRHLRFTKKSFKKYCKRERRFAHRCLIAVYLKCNAVNPLVAFYDISGRKGEVLSFFPVSDTHKIDFLNILSH